MAIDCGFCIVVISYLEFIDSFSVLLRVAYLLWCQFGTFKGKCSASLLQESVVSRQPSTHSDLLGLVKDFTCLGRLDVRIDRPPSRCGLCRPLTAGLRCSVCCRLNVVVIVIIADVESVVIVVALLLLCLLTDTSAWLLLGARTARCKMATRLIINRCKIRDCTTLWAGARLNIPALPGGTGRQRR